MPQLILLGYQVLAKRRFLSLSSLLPPKGQQWVIFFYGFDRKMYFSAFLTQTHWQGKVCQALRLYFNYKHFFFTFQQ